MSTKRWHFRRLLGFLITGSGLALMIGQTLQLVL